MNEKDVIVIGAGAAGLMCARELTKAGINVKILEARNGAGGRIQTITDNRFPLPVEAGAEFVHGNLPVTKQLLDEAKLHYYKMEGDLWRSEKGEFIEQEDFIEDIDSVIKQLKKLQTDISVADFLNTYFKEQKYEKVQKTLRNYVEGYDAADTTRASAFALLRELSGEDNDQYRVKGGYQKLVDHLVSECKDEGCDFYLNTIVKEIRWQKNLVEVLDQNANHHIARKIVITVPLGVLQSSADSIGHITFSPAINKVQSAIDSLGYGAVIKIVLHFDEPIWSDVKGVRQNKRSAPAFVFSDASIPTWWTQLPEKNGMITGWLAGPKAIAFLNEPDDEILRIALESLSQIFNIPLVTLMSRLISSHVHNWSKDDFSRGAYSYETVDSKNAKRIICEGVEDTLFFAGEAYHEGSESGTVEAALASGEKIAQNILQRNNP
jgi:monoamine oxidase